MLSADILYRLLCSFRLQPLSAGLPQERLLSLRFQPLFLCWLFPVPAHSVLQRRPLLWQAPARALSSVFSSDRRKGWNVRIALPPFCSTKPVPLRKVSRDCNASKYFLRIILIMTSSGLPIALSNYQSIRLPMQSSRRQNKRNLRRLR